MKVRRLDGEYEGLEEWVPKVRLVVPWDEQEALLEDERRMFAALEASGDVSGNLDLSRSWWTDNEAFRERAEARLEELRPIFAIVRGGAGKGPKRSSAR